MEVTREQLAGNLDQVLRILRRRGWIIVLCLVGLTVGSYVLARSQTKEYTATASLVFNQPNVAAAASGVPIANQNDPVGQQQTNLALVGLSQSVAQRASQLLGGRISADQIRSALSASQQNQSYLVTLAATWRHQRMAADIANAYAAAFVQQQQATDEATIQNGIDLVQAQYAQLAPSQRKTTQGQSLADRIESLMVLRAMQSNVRIAQAATAPSSPSSPRIKRSTILGALLGLLLGLGLVFVVERLDRRLREPSDVEEAFGLPVLGVIPHAPSPKPTSAARPMQGDAFQLLRAHLRYFNIDRELRTLLVTSGEPAEGKTTVAYNLAAAAAAMGSSTLLIEADLRRPALSRHLELPPSKGLTGALTEHKDFAGAVIHVTLSAGGGASDSERGLAVLPAGPVPPNPAELLESESMAELLAWARATFDFTVIDTPPIATVADAIPLIRRVDGLLVVGRLGRTSRDRARRLRERLDSLGAPALGIVVNDVRAGDGGYYGYGYDSRYYTRADANGSAEPVTELSPDAWIPPHGHASSDDEASLDVGSTPDEDFGPEEDGAPSDEDSTEQQRPSRRPAASGPARSGNRSS